MEAAAPLPPTTLPPPLSPLPPPLPWTSLLLALPDHLLLRALRTLHPSPDLFAVALACKRLAGLVSGPRAYLVVSPPPPPSRPASARQQQQRPPPPPAPPPRPCSGAAYADLASAVWASRPGDTILLSPTPRPGPPHRTPPGGVRVSHPLQILGGGGAPCDTRLVCESPSAPAALDFSAARARLANVTVVHRGGGGCGGAAVLHRSGRLRVERCRLRGARHALPGLAAPLVTVAAVEEGEEGEAGAAAVGQAAAVGRAGSGRRQGGQEDDGRASAPAGSRHVLTVAETELGGADGGGGPGLRALGTGAASGVRLMCGGRRPAPVACGGDDRDERGFDGTLLWLEVDAARPGERRAGDEGAAAALLGVGDAPLPPPTLPPRGACLERHPLAPRAWRGRRPDDALLRINALLGKRGRAAAAGPGEATAGASAAASATGALLQGRPRFL